MGNPNLGAYRMSELKVAREKYWEEKSESEKVEALGECVRRLGDALYRCLGRLDELEGHTHDTSGRAVVLLNNLRNRETGGYHQWTREIQRAPEK